MLLASGITVNAFSMGNLWCVEDSTDKFDELIKPKGNTVSRVHKALQRHGWTGTLEVSEWVGSEMLISCFCVTSFVYVLLF